MVRRFGMLFIVIAALSVSGSCTNYAPQEEQDPPPLTDTDMNLTGELEDTTTLAPATADSLIADTIQ